jgi:UDP-glucose 4-epimerase
MIIARISNPYGPGQDYHKGVGFIDAVLKKAMTGEDIEIWGDGTTQRDYIFIQDACRMIASLIDYCGMEDVFNISLNRGASQKEILEIVKNLGLDFHVHYVAGRSVDAKKIVLDNTKIRRIYAEKLVDLEEGIRLYHEYLEKEMQRNIS